MSKYKLWYQNYLSKKSMTKIGVKLHLLPPKNLRSKNA